MDDKQTTIGHLRLRRLEMKVKCQKIIDPMTGVEEETSSWLTISKTYLVLSLYVFKDRDLLFRLIGDDLSTPILVNARQFFSVCFKVPSNWRAIVDNDGNFRLTPESWTRSGFWDDYFNRESSAERVFFEEYEIMKAEDS